MENAILKKLNAKGQTVIYVLGAPIDLTSLLADWEKEVTVKRKTGKEKIAFAMAFCTKQAEVDGYAEKLNGLADGDAQLWFCYPKGSSKKYKCDFNRDTGWQRLGELGWEPVRMVAIDNDWSALRFRKADYIKKMTRSFAMTVMGKQKVAGNKSNKSST